MQDEKIKIQIESIKWMISVGMLNDPQVKNHIVLNIYDVDLKITDVQILMDTYKQKLLVHVDLTLWARIFNKKTILENITIRLDEMIPEYKVRVINNLDLFKKALDLIRIK